MPNRKKKRLKLVKRYKYDERQQWKELEHLSDLLDDVLEPFPASRLIRYRFWHDYLYVLQG